MSATLTPAQLRTIAERWPDKEVIVSGMRTERWVQAGSVWVGAPGDSAGIVVRRDGTVDDAS
jgi:hypothetical protein